MKSIAIAGFAPSTLSALSASSVDEIWTLNHAFAMDWAIPRFDRLFELHKRRWFLRDDLASLARYKEWLSAPHPFPIYMQDVDPDFPSSVKYPFDAVCADIFGRLLRGGERNLYFTSSFSYMLGLAVYERVGRVEIYGVEMGTDTEYRYQKPSAELMIGVALGRGIEVVLQPGSELCKAQLYAYDRVPAAERERAEQLAAHYEAEAARMHLEMTAAAAAYNARQVAEPADYLKASALSAINAGGAEILHLLSSSAAFLGRQQLEKQLREARDVEERWLALTNDKQAVYRTYTLLDTDGGAGRAWREYLDARWSMFAACGRRQAIQKLIDECDMRVVGDDLRLEIVDE